MRVIFFCVWGVVLMTLTSCDFISSGGGGSTAPRTMMVPVYESFDTVRMLPPRPAENLSRIYSFPPYVFMVEEKEGFHIIDNRNPKAPKNTHFLSIPGLLDIEFANNMCYASTKTEILAIAFQADTAEVVQRLYNPNNINKGQEYPLDYEGYFVCPDLDKKVINWSLEPMDEEPNCRI